MIFARVVLPEPGGPQKMQLPTWPRRMRSPSARPGPRRCSWPRKSPRVFGRSRAARGSEEPWKREGSLIGKREAGWGIRDWGLVRSFRYCLRQNGCRATFVIQHSSLVKQLETLEAWKSAERIAREAYSLTLKHPLQRHFGLADQIRRAAVSVPANIVEGYALGTTAQFVRFLKIALGSAAELQCHLRIARDLELCHAAT